MKLKNIEEIDLYFTQDKQGKEYKFVYKELYGTGGRVELREIIKEGIFLSKKLEGIFIIENNIKTENKSKIILEILISNGDKEFISLESRFGPTYQWFNKPTDFLELTIK